MGLDHVQLTLLNWDNESVLAVNEKLKGGSLAKARKLFFSGEVIFGGQNPKNEKKKFKKFHCPKSLARPHRSPTHP